MSNIFGSAEQIKNALPNDKTFTFVGGCFDLIHVGHVHLLEYASSLEDLLVVAVLSDSYAKKYKDLLRPVINEKQRLKMVSSIRFVDLAYISEVSPNDLETLKILKPDTIVFEEESKNTKRMKERLENISLASSYTKIRFLPRYNEEKISTSYIIDKIRKSKTSLKDSGRVE